ncbi:hypothetical protein PybrP1_010623 [[Pythium] brassicae (nom. inval.)]|nr:hypothetical protein PybrP1_010623 [[Pythium] brassicae (nom. inval.)]
MQRRPGKGTDSKSTSENCTPAHLLSSPGVISAAHPVGWLPSGFGSTAHCEKPYSRSASRRPILLALQTASLISDHTSVAPTSVAQSLLTWFLNGYRKAPAGLPVIRPDLDVHMRVCSVEDSTPNKHLGSLKFWHWWTAGNPKQGRQRQSGMRFVAAAYNYDLTAHTAVRHCTISNALAGIRHFFDAFGLTFPTHNHQLRMILCSIGRAPKPRSHKGLVLVEPVKFRLQSIDLSNQSVGLLSAADVTVVGAGGKQTLNLATGVSVKIILDGSKANQAGNAFIQALSQSGQTLLCPVLGALLCLKTSESAANLPVANFPDSFGGIASASGYNVTATLKDAAARISFDHIKYSHTLSVREARL